MNNIPTIYNDKPTLASYSNNLESQLKVCELLIASGLLPPHLKTKAAVYMIVLTGQEYGFTPLRSINLFDMIKGRVAPRAAALQAIAQANGGKFKTIASSNESVTVQASRGDWSENYTFSMSDAKQAGLNGDNWQKYPKDMMYARCTARLCRHGWADIIGGLHAAEELEDAEQSQGVAVVTDTPTIQKQYNYTYNIESILADEKGKAVIEFLVSNGADGDLDKPGIWYSEKQLKRLDKYEVKAVPEVVEATDWKEKLLAEPTNIGVGV